MNLYIWREVLCDYSCGIMAAFGNTPDEARLKILKAEGYTLEQYKDAEEDGYGLTRELHQDPEILGIDEVIVEWGGG